MKNKTKQKTKTGYLCEKSTDFLNVAAGSKQLPQVFERLRDEPGYTGVCQLLAGRQ
jgi:hypothetical protein